MQRITQTQIAAARQHSIEMGKPLLAALNEALALTSSDFVDSLALSLGWRSITQHEMRQCEALFNEVPFTECLTRQCIPLSTAQGHILVVLADPFDQMVMAWSNERIRGPFEWCLAQAEDVSAYLASYEQTQRAMDSVMGGDGEGARDNGLVDISLKSISEDTSPVVKAVNSTLYDALRSGVSDIHIESNVSGLSIKYRIDGVLSHISSINGLEMAEQLVSRLKVMSELDISERRVPQDGRFKAQVSGREVDFRVSIIPSMFGEDAVLRILDKKAVSEQGKGLRLDVLGLDDYAVEMVRRLAREPYGMVLVTGPTGSGKTTTLYGAVSEVNTGQDKIITIEDPVEYQLPGVLQIPVNDKKGLTFAKGLRAILRHDPDIIMVGEIRDGETAQIAVQAALTGHLVFSTVHANSVFDVIGRFMHMNVDPFNLMAALNGILAQRLIRLICTECSESYTPDLALLTASGLLPDCLLDYNFRRGSGCSHCRGTGYKGRKAIAEVLQLNDYMRELILARAPVSQLKLAAKQSGMINLRGAALLAVKEGKSTLEEINRVTFVE